MKRISEFLGRGSFFIVSGVLLLIITYLVSKFLIPVHGQDGMSWLLELKTDAYLGGSGLVILGLLTNHVDGLSKEAWSTMQPRIEVAIREVHKEVVEIFRMSRFEECLSRAKKEELDCLFPAIYAELYGKHLLQEDSVAKIVAPKVYEYFDGTKPYRKNYFRNVQLIKTKDPSKMTWEEVTTFEIRCPVIETGIVDGVDKEELYKKCEPYPLGYRTKFVAEPVCDDSSLKEHSIKIFVEDKCLLDSEVDIEFDGERISSNVDGVNVEYDTEGETLEIDYREDLTLDRPITRVRIVERTIVDSSDDYFLLRTRSLIHQARINITLPPGWKIREVFYPGIESWEISKNSDRSHLLAENKDWVLPDFVIAVLFERPDS